MKKAEIKYITANFKRSFYFLFMFMNLGGVRTTRLDIRRPFFFLCFDEKN